MKRLLSLTLCLIVAVSLIGCSQAPAAKLTRGTWDGDVYKSEFLGLTFTKPESWVIATDEEMEQIFGVSMDLLGKDENTTEATKQQVLFDIMVQDPATMSNINFMFQNLAATPGGKAMTEETFAKATVDQASAIEGVTYTADELKTVTIGGNEYKYMTATMTMQGVEMPQVAIMRKVGNYIFNATATMTGGETVEEILAMFS